MAFSRNSIRTIARRGIVLFFVLASASVSTAQNWKQIGTLSSSALCAYFFDVNHGVAGAEGTIWRYTNGAWTQIFNVPSGTTSYFTSINQLSPGVLYATSGDADVWFSSDSGSTWQNSATAGSFALDAYITKGTLYATYSGTYARLDTNICIVTNNNGSVPYYSTNGGVTWTHPSGTSGIEGLGAYADTCRKIFFVSSKDSTAFYSLDSGHTWHACGPKFSEDILNGADGVVCHQDTTGVWCSVDAGTSWQFLGGPKATGGQRGIFEFGPKGKYIVAMSGETLWLDTLVDKVEPTDPITRPDTSENCPIARIPITVRPFVLPVQMSIRITGTGPQSLTPNDTIFELLPGPAKTFWFNVTPSIAQYSSHFTISTTATDGCRTWGWIDTFSIVTVPLPFQVPNIVVQNCIVPRISISAISATQPLRMHLSISADSGWTVHPTDTSLSLAAGHGGIINLTPTAPSLPIGTIIQLHVTDTVACTVYVWDTSFTISVKPVPVHYALVDSVGITACDSIRIPIAFDLASCDSLNVDELTVNPPNGLLTFEGSPGLPLARGQKDTLWLRYAPHGRNDLTHYLLTINSHFVPESTVFDTTLAFIAVSSGSPEPRVSVSPNLNIASCNEVAFPVYIKAAGCEDIQIDSLLFSETGLIVSGGPSTVDTVLAGKTDTLHYTIEALYPGSRPLNITCYLYRLGDELVFDTTISLTLDATGADAQPLISAAPKLDLSNCSTSIVPFVLHAPCDNVTITSCDLAVAKGLNYDTNLTFPLKLDAEASDSLLLSFPPQGLNLTTTILAEIKGTYGGTSNAFDTTAQTIVTFACAGVSEEAQGGPPLVLTGLSVTSGELQLWLTKNDAAITECQAEIVTVLGTVAASRSLPLISTQNPFDWDLNGLPSGTYYLRLVSGDNRLSAPFVLIR